MQKFSLIVFIITVSFFSGCAKYWYCGDKSYMECKKDFTECRIECGRYMENDFSISNRSIKYEEKCMREKGYRLVSEGSLPLNAKRRKPDIVYKEKYGIAGSLDFEIEPETEKTE